MENTSLPAFAALLALAISGSATAQDAGAMVDHPGVVERIQKIDPNVDLSGVTETSDIRIVKLSELGEATPEQATALEDAITRSAASLEALRTAIQGNTVLGAWLSEVGISTQDIIAIELGEEPGAMTVYVDDRS